MNINNLYNIKEYIEQINPKLYKLLETSGATLSGSTAVYFYMKSKNLEPNFVPDDLDIYVTVGYGFSEMNRWYDKMLENKEMILFKKNPSDLPLNASIEQIDQYSSAEFEIGISCYSGKVYGPVSDPLKQFIPPAHSNIIECVRYGYVKNYLLSKWTKIDIIVCKSDPVIKSPTDFIDKYFDIDVCKCFFNSNGLGTLCPEIFDSSLQSHGSSTQSKFMSSILKKYYVSFNKDLLILDTLDYENMIKTHASVSKNPDDYSMIDHLKIISRIEKYKKRGFDITVDDNFNIIITDDPKNKFKIVSVDDFDERKLDNFFKKKYSRRLDPWMQYYDELIVLKNIRVSPGLETTRNVRCDEYYNAKCEWIEKPLWLAMDDDCDSDLIRFNDRIQSHEFHFLNFYNESRISGISREELDPLNKMYKSVFKCNALVRCSRYGGRFCLAVIELKKID